MHFLIYFNVAVFAALAFLHIYWAMGGTWGLNAAVPEMTSGQKALQPGKLATFAVALGLLLFALINLSFLKEFHVAWRPGAIRWLLIFIALIFLLRTIGDFKYTGLFKKHRLSKFAQRDSAYYSPLPSFCLSFQFIYDHLVPVLLLPYQIPCLYGRFSIEFN